MLNKMSAATLTCVVLAICFVPAVVTTTPPPPTVVLLTRVETSPLSDAVIVDKKTFVRSCQAFRPKQFFKDFTNADINYNCDDN
jgi:hypothetical protein